MASTVIGSQLSSCAHGWWTQFGVKVVQQRLISVLAAAELAYVRPEAVLIRRRRGGTVGTPLVEVPIAAVLASLRSIGRKRSDMGFFNEAVDTKIYGRDDRWRTATAQP